MRIYNNVTSLKNTNILNKVNKNKAGNLERLSSGLRINKASDDAAGLAISEKMRSQISGMKQSVRNASDGQALLQTAEGALGEIGSILQRMRELTVQAANDTNSDSERTSIETELTQLDEQITSIVEKTSFNEVDFLNGGTTLTLQIGANSGDTLEIDFTDMSDINPDIDLSDAAASATTLEAIDIALETINTERATLGAQVNRLDFTINNLNTSIENLTDAESRIRDIDMAAEMVEFSKNNVLAQVGNSMLAQANAMPQSVLQLL